MRKRGQLKVLIADDHPLLLEGLKLILREIQPEVIILEGATVADVLEHLDRESGVDLVVMDRAMPGMDGFDGLRLIKERHPDLPVVIHSAYEERKIIQDAFSRGVVGYIPKSSPRLEVKHALELALKGRVYLPPLMFNDTSAPPQEPPPPPTANAFPSTGALARLTPRQREVLHFLEQGMSNKEIARLLNCAENTVKNHVAAILHLLGVSNRIKALEEARRQRLLARGFADDATE